MILGAAVLATLAVFMAAFRFALREAGSTLPRAQALPAKGGTMRLVQAGFVALAMTSVFVMIVCALGIVALVIAG
jgi:hypothetical protein